MDTNDKAAHTIDFNQAKVTSTYKNISRQIVDSNDAVVRTIRRLQTSLDINTLIDIFHQELSDLMQPGQVRFESTDGQVYSFGDDPGAHSCQFNLALEQFRLGKLTIARRKRYSEDEISIVEFMASTLAFPLRNALLYKHALSNSLTDELTGMGNKRALQASLHREAERAIRQKSPMSVVMFDIDYFKNINDSYGHQVGDSILSQLAELVKSNARKSDLCFRYGGEEFVLILDDTNIIQAQQTAERLRAIIERHGFESDKKRIDLTASFGCASFDPTEHLEALVERADKALYVAKRTGRNQVKTIETQAAEPNPNQANAAL